MNFQPRNRNIAPLRSQFQELTLWHSIEDEHASTIAGGSGDPDKPMIVGIVPDAEATQKIRIRLKSYDH
jgi:hypothetical protein